MALIYLVEDDESIREIESIALKNSGHEVIGFENATAFFKGIESIIPDLILLDVMLPDMNGNEILARLRKKTDTRKVPVIMVTAKTTELDMMVTHLYLKSVYRLFKWLDVPCRHNIICNKNINCLLYYIRNSPCIYAKLFASLFRE